MSPRGKPAAIDRQNPELTKGRPDRPLYPARAAAPSSIRRPLPASTPRHCLPAPTSPTWPASTGPPAPTPTRGSAPTSVEGVFEILRPTRDVRAGVQQPWALQPPDRPRARRAALRRDRPASVVGADRSGHGHRARLHGCLPQRIGPLHRTDQSDDGRSDHRHDLRAGRDTAAGSGQGRRRQEAGLPPDLRRVRPGADRAPRRWPAATCGRDPSASWCNGSASSPPAKARPAWPPDSSR